MGTRYFSAIAFHGRLFVEGILARGPWDPARLVWWDEAQVDLILNELVGGRKVRTAAALDKVLSKSRLGLPSLKVWVMEGLEDEARKFRGT